MTLDEPGEVSFHERVLERVVAGNPAATDSSSAAVSMNPLRAGPGDRFDSEVAHIDTPLDKLAGNSKSEISSF